MRSILQVTSDDVFIADHGYGLLHLPAEIRPRLIAFQCITLGNKFVVFCRTFLSVSLAALPVVFIMLCYIKNRALITWGCESRAVWLNYCDREFKINYVGVTESLV